MSEPYRQFLGDAEYDFILTPELVIELERKVGAGIGLISHRFYNAGFSLSELMEIIRLALIGGGLDPKDASALVSAYAARQSVRQLYATALPVLDLLMLGEAAEKVPSTKFIANGEDAL